MDEYDKLNISVLFIAVLMFVSILFIGAVIKPKDVPPASYYEVQLSGNIQIGSNYIGYHAINKSCTIQKIKFFNNLNNKMAKNSIFTAPAAAFYDIRVHTSMVINSQLCDPGVYITSLINTKEMAVFAKSEIVSYGEKYCEAGGSNTLIQYLDVGDIVEFLWSTSKVNIDLIKIIMFVKQL